MVGVVNPTEHYVPNHRVVCFQDQFLQLKTAQNELKSDRTKSDRKSDRKSTAAAAAAAAATPSSIDEFKPGFAGSFTAHIKHPFALFPLRQRSPITRRSTSTKSHVAKSAVASAAVKAKAQATASGEAGDTGTTETEEVTYGLVVVSPQEVKIYHSPTRFFDRSLRFSEEWLNCLGKCELQYISAACVVAGGVRHFILSISYRYQSSASG